MSTISKRTYRIAIILEQHFGHLKPVERYFRSFFVNCPRAKRSKHRFSKNFKAIFLSCTKSTWFLPSRFRNYHFCAVFVERLPKFLVIQFNRARWSSRSVFTGVKTRSADHWTVVRRQSWNQGRTERFVLRSWMRQMMIVEGARRDVLLCRGGTVHSWSNQWLK